MAECLGDEFETLFGSTKAKEDLERRLKHKLRLAILEAQIVIGKPYLHALQGELRNCLVVQPLHLNPRIHIVAIYNPASIALKNVIAVPTDGSKPAIEYYQIWDILLLHTFLHVDCAVPVKHG